MGFISRSCFESDGQDHFILKSYLFFDELAMNFLRNGRVRVNGKIQYLAEILSTLKHGIELSPGLLSSISMQILIRYTGINKNVKDKIQSKLVENILISCDLGRNFSGFLRK